MLLGAGTLLHVAVVPDFEFMNDTPAQFTYKPPWQLLFRGPGTWIEHNGMDEFLASYVAGTEQVMGAMGRV